MATYTWLIYLRRFAYQKLKGWRPTFSAHNAELFFLAVGTLMLALGIPILVASLNVREYSVRYDDAGPFATLNSTQQQGALWAASDAGIVYSVNLKVDANMEPPVSTTSCIYHSSANAESLLRHGGKKICWKFSQTIRRDF